MNVHERIAAAVAERRAEVRHMHPRSTRAFILAACDYTDKVLARHGPVQRWDSGTAPSLPVCWTCETRYPCPEVHDLADLWLGPGWEQQS